MFNKLLQLTAKAVRFILKDEYDGYRFRFFYRLEERTPWVIFIDLVIDNLADSMSLKDSLFFAKRTVSKFYYGEEG